MRICKHFSFLYDVVRKGLTKPMIIKGHNVGGRFSSKSKSELIVAVSSLFLDSSGDSQKKIKMYWTRYEVSGARENFDECLDTLEELNVFDKVLINRSNMTIKYRNNELRFIGYKSNTTKRVSKLGIRRSSNTDLIVWIVDEIFEFKSKDEIQDIREAIGGAKSVVELFSTNPWTVFHWYIKDLNSKIVLNEEQLKTKGYQFKMVINKPNEQEWIFWSNHRVNEYLSEIQHKMLTDMWKYDPIRAAVVDYGMMGMEQGGIYTAYLDKIPDDIPDTYQPHLYKGGSDSGITRDATTYYLISHNIDKTEWGVHGEYYHSHETQEWWVNGVKQNFRPKNIVEYAQDGVLFYKQWSTQLNIDLKQGAINVYGDNTSALYQTVEHYASLMQASHLINSLPCVKLPIGKRIDGEHFLMSRGKLFIDKKKCPKLWEELNMAVWEDNASNKKSHKFIHSELKRLDGKDHGINAFEYGVGTDFHTIMDNKEASLYKRVY